MQLFAISVSRNILAWHAKEIIIPCESKSRLHDWKSCYFISVNYSTFEWLHGKRPSVIIDCEILLANCFPIPSTKLENLTQGKETLYTFAYASLIFEEEFKWIPINLPRYCVWMAL